MPLLIKLVPQFLIWLFAVISLPIAPSLKLFSPFWPTWWQRCFYTTDWVGSVSFQKSLVLKEGSTVVKTLLLTPAVQPGIKATGSVCSSAIHFSLPARLRSKTLVSSCFWPLLSGTRNYAWCAPGLPGTVMGGHVEQQQRAYQCVAFVCWCDVCSRRQGGRLRIAVWQVHKENGSSKERLDHLWITLCLLVWPFFEFSTFAVDVAEKVLASIKPVCCSRLSC